MNEAMCKRMKIQQVSVPRLNTVMMQCGNCAIGRMHREQRIATYRGFFGLFFLQVLVRSIYFCFSKKKKIWDAYLVQTT